MNHELTAPVVISQSEKETTIALEIARVIYSGVAEDTQQWANCLAAARAVVADDSISITIDRSWAAKEAFAKCDEFNQKYPNGTEGFIKDGESTTSTVVENIALVFPDPRDGQRIMAWFRRVGWESIDKFSPGRQEHAPTLAEEIIAVGQQIKAQGRVDMALYIFESALTADASCWHALNELGVIAMADQKYAEAVDYYFEALTINPKSAEMLTNRAMALRAVGRLDEALADSKEALRLMPANETIRLNEAYVLDDMMRIDECLQIIDDHIYRKPTAVNARYAKAMILLSAGRLEEGWSAFDWRLRLPTQAMHYEHYDIPRCEPGQSLSGKRVLLWPEQGIGDEIMTATMIPDLIEAVGSEGEVTILTSDRLLLLFRRSFGAKAKIKPRPSLQQATGLLLEKLPVDTLPQGVREQRFDVQVSQGDLGRMFRPGFDSFPASRDKILSASDFLTEATRDKFQTAFPRKNLIGLCWHSARNILIGKMKSIGLAALAPLFEIENVVFVNLQYGDCSAEIAEAKREFGIDLVPSGVDPLMDLDGYASMVAAMDLVITVSQTTAHLAGALGIPTWVMVPEGPGRLWYWHREGDRSPWYPSVRLFRQSASLQWAPVVEKVATELKAWAK